MIRGVDRYFGGREAMLRGKLPRQSFDRRFFAQVIIEMANVPSNDGTRDCQMDRVIIPNTHDLNVFAPGRVLAGTISSIDACFDRENESFQRAKRGIADADRRVVRKGTSAIARPPRSRALSTLWRISPNRLRYSRQRLRDRFSASASQIVSG